MPLFSQASAAARMALIYITVGSLTVVWTVIWFVYLRNNPPATNQLYYWCAGLLVTGLILVLIGLGVGHIGRAARPADHPPQATPPAAASTAPNAAAPPAVSVPVATPLPPGNGLAPAPAPPVPRN